MQRPYRPKFNADGDHVDNDDGVDDENDDGVDDEDDDVLP